MNSAEETKSENPRDNLNPSTSSTDTEASIDQQTNEPDQSPPNQQLNNEERSSIANNSESEINNLSSEKSLIDQRSSTPSKQSSELNQTNELEMLSGKMQSWLNNKDLPSQLRLLVSPLLILAGLILLVVLLQVYGSILNGISKFPLAPRIFEFVGIIWLIRFSTTRIARSKDRNELYGKIKNSWFSFFGEHENES